MMMLTRRVGMRRLATPWTMAIVALAAQSTVAAAQVTSRVFIRGMSDSVKTDSVRVPSARSLVLILKKIDSLAQLQDGLPIGSPEYARINDQLQTAIRATLPSGATYVRTPDGMNSITLAPSRTSEIPSGAVFAAPRAMVDIGPRGWVGFTADGVHREWAEADGFHIQYFVYPIVVAIDPNSPASRVGLQFGDSLIAYDGMDLRRNTFNLTKLIEPGRPIRIALRRDGETRDISITPEKLPPSMERERRANLVAEMLAPTRPAVVIGDSLERRFVEQRVQAMNEGFATTVPGRPSIMTKKVPSGGVMAARGPSPAMTRGILGASLTDIDRSAALALTRNKKTHGVFVSQVPDGSPAARLGLRSADVIVSIDDVEIFSVAQLIGELRQRDPSRVTRFTVVRAGAGKTTTLTYDPK